jgi:hypothetical protein
MELPAGRDPELGEDLAQVPFHGARAQVELEPDLLVRQSFTGEPGDLRLLAGEIVRSLHGLCPDLLAGGRQLAPGALENASIPMSANISNAQETMRVVNAVGSTASTPASRAVSMCRADSTS